MFNQCAAQFNRGEYVLTMRYTQPVRWKIRVAEVIAYPPTIPRNVWGVRGMWAIRQGGGYSFEGV